MPMETKKYGPKFIGRVAKILNTHTILITAGSNKGLSVGDKIQIYSYIGTLENDDPELVISDFEMVKAELTVVRCEETYSICKTHTYKKKSPFVASPLLTSDVEVYSDLKVSTKDITDLSLDDYTIHIGDPVKEA